MLIMKIYHLVLQLFIRDINCKEVILFSRLDLLERIIMASTSSRRFFVGGNWKMNYSKAVLEKVNEALGKTKDADGKNEFQKKD
jgi:hypothetical protein